MKNLPVLPPALRPFAEPHEVWLAAGAIATGIPAALGYVQPHSLVVQLPHWLLPVWGVMLIIGGVATFVARIWIARPLTEFGVRSAQGLELVGQIVLATAIGIYAVAILAAGLSGVPAGALMTGLTGAFVMRAWIISRGLKRMRANQDPDG